MTALPRLWLFALAGVTAAWWSATVQGLPTADAVSKPQEAVRCVPLPRTRKGLQFDLYLTRTKAQRPAGVLVLCPDLGQDVKALLAEPGWQHFAEDHQLALVAVAALPAPTPTKWGEPLFDPAQSAAVRQALDRECGPDMPLLLYGWPQQATLAESLLAANTKRIQGWCLRVPGHLPALGREAPPGIVVCYKENKASYDALTQDYARARKQGAKVTWISLAGDQPGASSLPSLDAFVRSYLAAALAVQSRWEDWENLDTRQVVSAMDLNTHPERASYLPHVNLTSAWAALHVPGAPELALEPILEREENTYNPVQPKLHLYLRRPLSAQKVGGKIEGVLAFCTWNKEKASLTNRLQNKDDFLVRYAEEHRLALLTWDTVQAWSVQESADQRSQQENYQDNAGFEKLADAWERGMHVLCYEAKLPENDFLLYGISRGAQWAHRLALRKPGHFLAVHIHINSSYDWPTPAAKNILWLQTTGEREAGYEAAKRFYTRCRELGYPIIFKAGENLGHSDSAEINALGLRFFDYALSVKARRDAAVANMRTMRGKQAAPSLYALSGLGDAPFYGDFINQDVYGVEEKDMVPVGQRVPLPTQVLARAWGGSAEAPALLAVSNSVAVPAKSDPAKPAAATPTVAQGNYFGSTTTPAATTAEGPGSATAAPAVDVSKQDGHPGVAESLPKPEVSPPPAGQDFAERYRLAVQHAVTELPSLAQADSVTNEAFLGQYQRLRSSNDALLSDPSWPEQVAHLVKGQMAAHPDYAREFQASVERVVLVYPALAQADSPMNAAFLAEYQRLKAAGDALLSDPTWPEQVAKTANGKLAAP